MADTDSSLRRGALNLLSNCAKASAGETLLILHEKPELGYYGPGLAEAIAGSAGDIGLHVRSREVPFTERVDGVSAELAGLLATSDHVLFLARLGDQLRFQSMPPGARPIVSYVLDTEMLASPFGTAPYQAFVALKAAIDSLMAGACEIRVTCPLGTDVRGCLDPAATTTADVTVRRFPLSVFTPLAASGFSGRVAVARFLVGTGSQYYRPYHLPLESTLFAELEGNRVARWDGPASVAAKAQRHYEVVARRFDIDAGFVHSWHAGIHPSCAYRMPAVENYERWSGGAFGNPRLLHFHTCGADAPGEICWNIVDPTITIDGRIIWKHGRIAADEQPAIREILQRYPDVGALFQDPAQDIGLD
jgi:hypothetical protein